MSIVSSHCAQSRGGPTSSAFSVLQELGLAAVSALFVTTAFATVSDVDRTNLAAQGSSAVAAVNRAVEDTKRHNDIAARKTSVFLERKKNQPNLLNEQVDFGNSLADLPAPSSPDPKAVFDLSAAQVEAYCANAVSTLATSIKQEKHKAARVNAGGLLVSTIGGITVNPPYKALLMAIGISGGGDSKSVFSVLFGSLSDDASLDQADLDTMRTNYQSAMKDYRAVDPKNDSTGAGRADLLISAKSACDKLSPTLAPKPVEKASAPKASDPPAG